MVPPPGRVSRTEYAILPVLPLRRSRVDVVMAVVGESESYVLRSVTCHQTLFSFA